MVSRTTTPKTTSKKTATSSGSTARTAKPAAKTAAAAAPAQAAPATAAEASPAAAKTRKRELFNRVKARTAGVKGSDVRQVMDAVLDELGMLLVQGEAIDARPLGTIKVQKHKTMAGGDIVVCKLRRKKPSDGGKDPLAEAAE